ncbi:hypothetical protein B0H10DRAFT_2018968 [Mycena sp. CBHHK59/15]|nr:hypothetical protein B0H10DRAFT_2018968 [Mycena sp. CBHHK59/15]
MQRFSFCPSFVFLLWTMSSAAGAVSSAFSETSSASVSIAQGSLSSVSISDTSSVAQSSSPPPTSSSVPPLSSSAIVSSSSSAFTSASSSSTTSTPPTSTPPTSTPPTSTSPFQSSTLLTSPSTVVSRSTLIGTSNGQFFTTVIEQTSTIAAGTTVAASSVTSNSSSHTGGIVGGVIGGLTFLAIVAAAVLWFRRRSRYKSEFDGNFDPARVNSPRPVSAGPEMVSHVTGGTLPRMNIDDDEDDGMSGRLPHSTVGGGIVTPFTYSPTISTNGLLARSQSPPIPGFSPPPMSQHSQDGYAPTTSSAGGYYTAVPQQTQAVGGYYPPPAPSSSGSSGNQYNPRSAKEREALGARRSPGLGVANPPQENEPRSMSRNYDEQYQAYLQDGPQNASRRSLIGGKEPATPPMSPTASSSGASRRTSGVLVHQDGGRVDPAETVSEDVDEIPPTYDSIPAENPK